MDSSRTSPPSGANSNSPSSDKENRGKVTDDESAQKKWTPPKILPYKYSLKLAGQDKVIYGVPAQDLTRARRPPSKDLLRLFIRAYALRTGAASSPWHVRADIVTKYAIPNKFADLFVSSTKMKEYGQKAMDEASKKTRKRKLSCPKASTTTAKKQKRSPAKQPTLKMNGKRKGGTPMKATPTKMKSVMKSVDSSSDDDVTLADVRRQSDDDMSLSELRHKTLSDEDDVILADLNKSEGVKRKGMKQMTLFEMNKKLRTPKKTTTPKKSTTPSSSPRKTCVKSPAKTPYKQPPIVVRLLKAQKAGNKAFSQLLSMCARDLSSLQRNRLPESVKEEVTTKWNTIQEHKRIAEMTPEQRKDYMEKRRKEMRKEQRKKRALLNKRYEDTELDLKPLPEVNLVPTPETFPNELFGDVAMVTEFISCYNGLLVPHGKFQLVADSLMNALTSGANGFSYLSQIIMILLQTLLQDPITEHYREMSLPLSDLTINQYTSSELVRLCLRRRDDEDDDSASDDDSDCEQGEEDQVSDEIIDQLETTEFCDLDLGAKLEVLTVLCHHLMGSYAIQDFMTEKQQQVHQLWKKKLAGMKDKKGMREKMKKEKSETATEKDEDSKKEEGDSGKKEPKPLTLEHFYGRPTTTTTTRTAVDGAENGGEDHPVGSRAHSRRLGVQQELENRRQREMERCKQRDEQQKQNDQREFERTFLLGISAAKVVLRQMHIGSDRHHSRYWLFHDPSPGLYVEKGWAGKEISYQPDQVDKATNGNGSDASSESESETNQLQQQKCLENTTPPMGQNLWFRYDSVDQLDALLSALHPQGVRESALGDVLRKFRPEICNSMAVIAKRCKTEVGSETPDDKEQEVNTLQAFKLELLELQLRLRSGGLGSIVDFSSWSDTLHKASTVKECGDSLIECGREIPMKFRTGLLAKTSKKVKTVEDAGEDGSGDDEKTEEEVEEILEEVGLTEWKEAVLNCASVSRLHLLMAILDSSVKWVKSAEKAKCKICRKKADEEDTLLLCDGCNQAFHLYCLRPALLCIPEGDWFCPSCQLPSTRKNSRNKNYRHMAVESEDDEDDDDEEEEEEEEVQRECLMCDDRDQDDTIVNCSSCPSAFHQHCHQPPLQRMPRSTWRCCQCVTGVRIRKKSTRRRAAAKKKKRSDDYVYEDEMEEIEEKPSRRPPRRRLPPRRVSTEEEEDASDDDRRKRGRGRRKRVVVEEEEAGDASDNDVDRGTKKRGRGRPRKKAVEEKEEEDEEVVISSRATKRNSDGAYNGRMNVADKPRDDLKVLPTIVHRLQRHRLAWPFIDPVDTQQVPDYLDIVNQPMDLETVRMKCAQTEYETVDEFVADVTLVFTNATLYNQVGSLVGQCIEPVQTFFDGLLQRYLPKYCEETEAMDE